MSYVILRVKTSHGKSPPLYVYNLASLMVIGILVLEMFYFCHVISQDQIIKGPCDLMSRSPSSYFTTLPNLVAIGTIVMEICS